MNPQEKREIAAWTARWCRLAELNLEQLEAIEFDERMSQLGDVETLGLGLFAALDKVRFGAAAVLGESHPAVKAFDDDNPKLRDARNVLEHFEEYVRGDGHLQTDYPNQLYEVRIATSNMAGDGRRHHLSFSLVGRGQPDLGPYDLDTRAVVQAARQLRDVAVGVATDERETSRSDRSPD